MLRLVAGYKLPVNGGVFHVFIYLEIAQSVDYKKVKKKQFIDTNGYHLQLSNPLVLKIPIDCLVLIVIYRIWFH